MMGSPRLKPSMKLDNIRPSGMKFQASHNNKDDTEEHQDATLQWKRFLNHYASGENVASPPARPPLLPLSPGGILDERSPDTEKRNPVGKFYNMKIDEIYPSTSISDETCQSVSDYIRQNGYLPAPRSPHEVLRQRIVEEYDLYSPSQKSNVQSCLNVVSAFFPGCLCIFTLFHDRFQKFIAVAGPCEILNKYNIEIDQDVMAPLSLCGHAVLTNGMTFVPDLSKDWRFKENPYVKAGITSYIGQAVFLDPDPADILTFELDVEGDGSEKRSSEKASDVGIGVLSVLFPTPNSIDHVDPKQEMILKEMAKNLQVQLKAGWEGNTRLRESRERKTITDMIQEMYEIPKDASRLRSSLSGGSSGLNSTGGQTTGSASYGVAGVIQTSIEAAVEMRSLSVSAMRRLKELMPDIKDFFMIELRGVKINDTSTSDLPTYSIDNTSSHPIGLIASASDSHQSSSRRHMIFSPENILSALNLMDSPLHFEGDKTSGLENDLPSYSKSHIFVPFFTGLEPIFAIVGISHLPQIPDYSTRIVSNIGSILLAKSIQHRVVEADAAKTTFLSSISHELRTPMQAIIAGMHLMNSQAEKGEYRELVKTLKVVEASSNSLGNILDDILDFSHSSSLGGQSSLTLINKNCNLLEIVRVALNMCLSQFQDLGQGSSVTLEYDQRDWTVMADEPKCHRILVNGLTNALKFCKNGAITITLSATSSSSFSEMEDMITFTIKDSGKGFDQAMVPKLLLPFTKQDIHSSGAGLGLHIVKGLVSSLGGDLSIESVVGLGTLFKVQFKAEFVHPSGGGITVTTKKEKVFNFTSQSSSSDDYDERAFTPPDSMDELTLSPSEFTLSTFPELPYRPKRPVRIMVVDDNSVCRTLLSRALRRSKIPIKTIEAGDGQEAVDKFLDFKPDIVLTDVSMPIMNGIKAAQTMRSLEVEYKLRKCKIYAITGLGSSDRRLKATGMDGSAALDDWLTKGKENMPYIFRVIQDLMQERDDL